MFRWRHVRGNLPWNGQGSQRRTGFSLQVSFILMYYYYGIFLSLLWALWNIFLYSVRPTRWYLEEHFPLFLVETKSWWRDVAASSSSRVQAKLAEPSYWADRANIITIFTPLDLSSNRSEKQNRSILDDSIYEFESNHMTILYSMLYDIICVIHMIMFNIDFYLFFLWIKFFYIIWDQQDFIKLL